ncbi:hypothetical protein A2318_03910 [Candidatus Uhrbacteria bacterium RIFOXYB2_FULL_45_11]|uniref:Uncharacterized protein n=1 Tax=Candidatus Uhrbacteria bacterium RIFOXYB2_FULL_45_11 TaxID=1802421 RepID=A0A1F7W527_9BACT|nr:MAG: hypothetical protein A2318_03910 [Candidatus Uhrbacteria bacterium RIFOXYB2_FULL_45_11]
MKKTFLALCLVIVCMHAPTQIAHASTSDSPVFNATPELMDHTTFHVARYKTSQPIKFLGFVEGKLLASFSAEQHIWYMNGTFVPVTGADPAKALGYPATTTFTAEKFAEVAKNNSTTKACDKLKEPVVAQDEIAGGKNLCLTATPGGDFTVHLMPGDIKYGVGFGKQPMVKGTHIYWIGYDGNLYIASMHPSAFTETVTAIKSKTNSVVYLVRNGVRFQIPDEKTYYTWFPSFSAVKIQTAKQLASYPLIGKTKFRANTLLKFKGEPTVYAYQPANNPYVKYGKDVKIIEETPTNWTVLPVKSKTNETFTKQSEKLFPINSLTEMVDAYGPNWQKGLIELEITQKANFSIADKSFDSVWNSGAQ